MSNEYTLRKKYILQENTISVFFYFEISMCRTLFVKLYRKVYTLK